MVLSIVWASLLGAGLGLERHMRKAQPGVGPCALSAFCWCVIAQNLLSPALSANLPYALALASAGVAVAVYLSMAAGQTSLDNSTLSALADKSSLDCQRIRSAQKEAKMALVASGAFGLAIGMNAPRLAGAMALATIFSLAWRSRANDQTIPAPAKRASTIPYTPVDGRRPEESGNDNKGR